MISEALSQDLIPHYNLDLWLFDSSVGAFALTSLCVVSLF